MRCSSTIISIPLNMTKLGHISKSSSPLFYPSLSTMSNNDTNIRCIIAARTSPRILPPFKHLLSHLFSLLTYCFFNSISYTTATLLLISLAYFIFFYYSNFVNSSKYTAGKRCFSLHATIAIKSLINRF